MGLQNNTLNLALAVGGTGIVPVGGAATVVDGGGVLNLTRNEDHETPAQWVTFSNADATNYLVLSLGDAPRDVDPGLGIGIVVFPKSTTPPLVGQWKYAKAYAFTPAFAPLVGTINACVCARY